MTRLSLKDFENFWTYYKGEPHQKKAIEIMYGQMHAGLLDDEHSWVTTYRNSAKVTSTAAVLDCPYQSQNDNISGTGYRECFSSSCAMVAMFYGKIENDDAYNAIRQQYGDSTDAQAQLRALRSLGLEANFITNATVDDLKAQILANRPTPCGWLHHGTAHAPSGSGHWSVVCGFDDVKQVWVHNDPNGVCNLETGKYTSELNGQQIEYSYANWNPRWLPDGNGWMMDIRLPKP